MALHVGIVGLPNVGKSTLFNAVSAAGVDAANYPFATIEPNVGVVAVPDPRLDRLAGLAGSARVVPATVEFRDIAGLVAGASRGEGLGNQFLSHIREVDAIVHVVRCFDDPDIVHVDGTVDATRDVEVVRAELILKDLETVERRLDRATRTARSGDRAAREEAGLLAGLREHLERGRTARSFATGAGQRAAVADLFLLTSKPVLYAANVSEADLPGGNDHSAAVARLATAEGASSVVVCAEAEAQIAELDPHERAEFLGELGLERSGLDQLVTEAYRLLGLVTFFTAGPKEARAWTVPEGTTAKRAARAIHSDIERGFIRAEVISYDDYDRLGGEQAAKEAGRMRVEGRDYVVVDGDVVHFRFNV